MNPIRKCRAPECRAEIRFEPTHTGARIPLDAFPILEDNELFQLPVPGGYVYENGLVRPHQAGEGNCYMSHFTTCKDPNRFSGSKK